MITVSSREFRANQKNYLDQVFNGVEVLVKRGKQAFKITPVTDDDSLISKQKFFEKIENAIQEVKNKEFKTANNLTDYEVECIQRGLEDKKAGRTYAMLPGENIYEFLDRMEREGNV